MAYDALVRDIWDGKATYSFDYFSATADLMRNALYRGWKGDSALKLTIPKNPKLGLDYKSDDWRVVNAMEANLFRFSAAKTLDAVNKLNAELPNSKTFAEFKKNTAYIGVAHNENHLRTEYNFAWQVSQNAAEYQRMMEESDLYPYWQYLTAGDSHVRPAHRVLHGKIFKAGDIAYLPPLDWGCRCYYKNLRENNSPELWDKKKMIEALDSVVIDDEGTTEWERMKQNGMDTNRAITCNVFDLNKEYTAGLNAKLGIKDNGVEPFAKMKDLPKINAPERTAADAKAWYADNVKDKVITDYAGRPIDFEEKTVTSHTRNTKYTNQNRQGLLELVPDILNAPDEVWLQPRSGSTYQYLYMSMYEEGPVTVAVSLDNELRALIETWFVLNKQVDDRRSGILIHKKKK